METIPPLLEAELPARRLRREPGLEVEDPTAIEMPPAEPVTASPVSMTTSPVPAAALPLLMEIEPLSARREEPVVKLASPEFPNILSPVWS